MTGNRTSGLVPPGFLQAGGTMGALMRSHDWAATLGPAQDWPQTLRTALRILLASRQPMCLWWGEGLINFYNDAYLPVLAGRHPDALGRGAKSIWPEIWTQIESRIQAAMAGDASYAQAELMVLRRNGYPEEAYYTFSLSPVPTEDGTVGGILCAMTDDTERVIGARRLALLRELALRTWDARGIDDVYVLSAQVLATDARDIPFALLYRFAPGGAQAVLAGASGIAAGHAAAPETIALDGPGSPWPLAEVMRTGAPRRVERLAEKFGALPKGEWDVPPGEAVLLPLTTSAETAARGVLILGINPYRPHDEIYQAFAQMVSHQVAAALLTVEAFAAEHERAKTADVLALEIEHRRRIEKQQNLLLDELNHRVKNTLATVQAMAMQTLKGADAPSREAFLSRLFALSAQHDLLTLDNWEGASLEGVVRRALQPYRDEDRARFHVEGPPVHLDSKRALALGLGFHELATNAARYGALSNASGSVDVRWRLDPSGKFLTLRWEETGGPGVTPPAHKGFGLRLIEHGLGREISGPVTLSFLAGGLVCEWDMTL